MNLHNGVNVLLEVSQTPEVSPPCCPHSGPGLDLDYSIQVRFKMLQPLLVSLPLSITPPVSLDLDDGWKQGPEDVGRLSKLLANKEATKAGLELDDKANIGLPEQLAVMGSSDLGDD